MNIFGVHSFLPVFWPSYSDKPSKESWLQWKQLFLDYVLRLSDSATNCHVSEYHKLVLFRFHLGEKAQLHYDAFSLRKKSSLTEGLDVFEFVMGYSSGSYKDLCTDECDGDDQDVRSSVTFSTDLPSSECETSANDYAYTETNCEPSALCSKEEKSEPCSTVNDVDQIDCGKTEFSALHCHETGCSESFTPEERVEDNIDSALTHSAVDVRVESTNAQCMRGYLTRGLRLSFYPHAEEPARKKRFFYLTQSDGFHSFLTLFRASSKGKFEYLLYRTVFIYIRAFSYRVFSPFDYVFKPVRPPDEHIVRLTESSEEVPLQARGEEDGVVSTGFP